MQKNRYLNCIVQRYEKTVADAYEDYARLLACAGRTEAGQMDTSAMLDGSMSTSVQRSAGKLGAKLSAASKRSTREVLFAALQEAKQNGADVTPTIAINVAHRALGRGISMRAANTIFGTPGRTAAYKSAVDIEDLAELIDLAQQEIAELKCELMRAREHYRQKWANSMKRANLIGDWRESLGGKPLVFMKNV